MYVASTALSFLNQVPQTFLCALYGIPCLCYRLHHIVIHHAEDNVYPHDVSSTEPYQRDNVLHFLQYWMRFLFASCVELPYYCWKKGRYDLLPSAAAAVPLYIGAMYCLHARFPVQTLWVRGSGGAPERIPCPCPCAQLCASSQTGPL